MSKNPLVITLAIAALIVVAALGTLGVLSVLTDPGYGRRLATLARCSH